MTKKTQEEMGKVLFYILMAVALALFCFPFFALFKLLKARAGVTSIIKGIYNRVGDFWLSDQEKEQYKQCLLVNYKSQKELDETETANCLYKRSDGMYDARSYIGKHANDLLVRVEHSGELLQKLSVSPRKEWDDFNSFLRQERRWKYANILLFPWCLCAVVLYVGYENIFPVIISVLVLAVFQLVTYGISGWCIRKPALKYTPIPPLVTLKNVDDFSNGVPSDEELSLCPPLQRRNPSGVPIFGIVVLSMMLCFGLSEDFEKKEQQLSREIKEIRQQEGHAEAWKQKIRAMEEVAKEKKEKIHELRKTNTRNNKDLIGSVLLHKSTLELRLQNVLSDVVKAEEGIKQKSPKSQKNRQKSRYEKEKAKQEFLRSPSNDSSDIIRVFPNMNPNMQ